MRILETLSGPDDKKQGSVLVEVQPGEGADVEAMAALLLGENEAHLGLRAALVSTGPLPKDLLQRGADGRIKAPYQFGLPNLAETRGLQRYYEVTVFLK